MALSLNETAELSAQLKDLQVALHQKNKAQTIAFAINALHLLVCPKNSEDALRDDAHTIAETMFRAAIDLRVEALEPERRRLLADHLTNLLYILLRYGMRDAAGHARGIEFGSDWLNVWYSTAAHYYQSNGPTNVARRAPSDFFGAMIISSTRGNQRLAVVTTELSNMLFMMRSLAPRTMLAELFMHQFLTALEQRALVVYCGVQHLGDDTIAELLPAGQFRADCMSATKFWRGIASTPIEASSMTAEERAVALSDYDRRVSDIKSFLTSHDIVEVCQDAVGLMQFILQGRGRH